MKVSLHISVTGLDGMTNDFARLTTPEPYEAGSHALNAALRTGFEATQMAVPVGTGDARRPAGSLRDSGRFESEFDGEEWTGSISYGTNDDALPYAQWVMWRNVNKGKENYLYDPMDEATELFDHAVNAPFNDVFGED